YWRIAHFLFPFYTMIPTGVLGTQVLVRAWVPLDDEHVMFWSIGVPRSREGAGATGGASMLRAGNRSVAAAGARGGGFEYQPEAPDWLGKFPGRAEEERHYTVSAGRPRA